MKLNVPLKTIQKLEYEAEELCTVAIIIQDEFGNQLQKKVKPEKMATI